MTIERISELYHQLNDLEKTPIGAPQVRIYVRTDDGAVENLEATDLSGYAGVLPDVGDTISAKRPSGFEHYAVYRRIHISALVRNGWAILVSKLPQDPVAEVIAERWYFEAETLDDATVSEIFELRDELETLRKREEQEIQKQKLVEEIAKAERRKARLAADGKRAERREARRRAAQRSGEGQ